MQCLVSLSNTYVQFFITVALISFSTVMAQSENLVLRQDDTHASTAQTFGF